MKKLREFPHCTSNVMGEYDDGNGNLIISRDSKGTIVNYPLGNPALFRGKEPYGNGYDGKANEKYRQLVFSKTKPSMYYGIFKIEKASHGYQGVDKLKIIDVETGAYYSMEMYGIERMLQSIGDGNADIGMRKGELSLSGYVYFRFGGQTLFIEFLTTEYEEYVMDLNITKSITSFITPKKLKLWHSYKKKNAKMDGGDEVFCPYYYGTYGRSSRENFNSGQFYDEQEVDKDKWIEEKINENNRSIEYSKEKEKKYSWHTYKEDEVYGWRDKITKELLL